MKRINQISDISSLNLPNDILEELTIHLESCFDSKAEANQFWSEYGTFLTLVETGDADEWLEETDKKDGYWLDFIINNPEYVLLLGRNQPHLLALAIIDDAGAGAYLLISFSHQSRYTTILKNHLNNH